MAVFKRPADKAPGIIATYYQLTKPGIVKGNIVTAAAGFLLAARGHIDLKLLLISMAGIALIIAAACVYNNCLDSKIDAKMARTKHRAIVTGLVTPVKALLFGTSLLIVGFLSLLRFSNVLTALLGLLAFFAYVVVYGIAKRKTPYGTLVGCISGALPPVGGYTAVHGRLDIGALLLFFVLVAWQMSHFYAIAVYRLKDYQAAGIPVWPAKHGIENTKYQIVFFAIVFTIVASLLTLYGYTGVSYLAVVLFIGSIWVWRGVAGLRRRDTILWAREMFFFSLIVILVLSVMLSVGPILV